MSCVKQIQEPLSQEESVPALPWDPQSSLGSGHCHQFLSLLPCLSEPQVLLSQHKPNWGSEGDLSKRNPCESEIKSTLDDGCR